MYRRSERYLQKYIQQSIIGLVSTKPTFTFHYSKRGIKILNRWEQRKNYLEKLKINVIFLFLFFYSTNCILCVLQRLCLFIFKKAKVKLALLKYQAFSFLPYFQWKQYIKNIKCSMRTKAESNWRLRWKIDHWVTKRNFFFVSFVLIDQSNATLLQEINFGTQLW